MTIKRRGPMTNAEEHDYTDDRAARFWSREAQLESWCQIEVALICAKGGVALTPWQQAMVRQQTTPEAVATREQEVGHEVGAFLAQFDQGLMNMEYDPDSDPGDAYCLHPEGVALCRQYLHFGLTSSDLVESGKQIALWQTSNYLKSLLHDLANAIAGVSNNTLPGRTHGQVASPTSARWRFQAALPSLTDGWGELISHVPIKLSGATGRSRILSTGDQARVCSFLDSQFGVPAVLIRMATQVPPAHYVLRHLAKWLELVTACEQIALDYRLMVTLGAIKPRPVKVGSSAMPGKVNPYLAERLEGLASLWRGYYAAILNTRALWLDRDLTHSCVDREALPRLATLAAYMLRLASRLIFEAEYPAVDMSQYEPAVDADAILAWTIEEFEVAREEAYRHVAEVVRTTSSTDKAVGQISLIFRPTGNVATAIREYHDCYPGL